MCNDEIISYIKQNQDVEIAIIQKEFNATYKDVKSIIDRLISQGNLVQADGIKFKYIEKQSLPDPRVTDDDDDDSIEAIAARRRAYFDARRFEVIRRLRSEADDDDNDNDDDDNDEDDVIDSDFYEALKIAVTNEIIDCHLLRIMLNISMMKAMKIIKWLERNEFIDEGSGFSSTHSVLVTKRQAGMWLAEFAGDNSLMDEVLLEENYEKKNDNDNDMDVDELRYKALKLSIEQNSASVSLFQRTLPIGYIEACRLVDWMESMGYISISEGAKPRRVLITQEEFDKLYNSTHIEGSTYFDSDDEHDTDIDKMFDDYEKFLNKHFISGGTDDDDNPEDEDIDGDVINLFHSDKDECDLPEDNHKPNNNMQELVNILDKIANKKKAPVSADVVPSHNLWLDEKEFGEVVMERLRWIIESDKRMGQKGAVKKAETYLEAVRDTHDRKMVQVYERLVFELKNTSVYLYNQLKKQFFS